MNDETPKSRRSNLFPLSKNANDACRLYQDLELDVMARTVWGKARGEGISGMQAVAHVIINRVAVSKSFGGYWWGNNILEVCQKPYQFSCWNKDDPNRRLVIAVNEENDPLFATAKRTCSRVLLGFLPDSTYGADHYHARNILPHWAEGQNPTARIGRHIFYKLMRS